MLINFSILQIISLTTLQLITYCLANTTLESVVSVTCLLAWVLGWFFCGFGLLLSHQSLPLHHVRNSAPFSLLQLQQVRNLISPLNMLSSCPVFLHAQDSDMNQTTGYKGEFCWSWFLIYSFGAMLLFLSIHSAPISTEAAHSLKKTRNLRIKAGSSSYWYINSYCFIMYKCISQFTGNNYITLDILNHA